MVSKNREGKRAGKYFIAVVLLLIFHVVVLFFWLSFDQTSPDGDMSRHLGIGYEITEIIKGPTLDLLARIISIAPFYPPFFYILSSYSFLLFPFNTDLIVWATNSLLLAIIIFSTYGIGSQLYNRKVGLIAAILVSFYPLTQNFLRRYYNDLALAAFVVLTIYLLLKSENFQRRSYSLLLAIALGLGCLVKWTMPVFLLGPVIYVIISSIFAGQGLKLREVIKPSRIFSYSAAKLNFLIFFIITIGIISVWYPGHYKDVFSHYEDTAEFWIGGSYHPLSIRNIGLFFARLDDFCSHLLTGLICVGGILAIYHWRRNFFILIFFVIPYGFFTYLISKSAKHYLPFLPFLALVSCSEIGRFPRKISYAYYAVMALGIIYILLILFGVMTNESYKLHGPQIDDWKVKEFVELMYRDSGQKKMIKLCHASKDDKINPVVFRYYSHIHGINLVIKEPQPQEPLASLLEFDYMFIKMPMWQPNKREEEIEKMIEQGHELITENFTILKEEKMPDDSQALLLRKKIRSPGEEMAQRIKMLEQEIQQNPDNHQLYFSLAAIYENMRRSEDAKKTYQRAVELLKPLLNKDQDNVTYHLYIARAYKGVGDYNSAIEHFEWHIKTTQYAANSYLGLAEIYETMHNMELAEENYQRAVQSAPNLGWVHMKLADFYWRTKKIDQAIKILNKTMKIDPDNYNCYFYSVRCLIVKRNFSEALAVNNEALNKWRDKPLFAFLQGVILYSLGQVGEARTWLIEFCRAYKRNDAYRHQAITLLRKIENRSSSQPR